jgi:hypothetical protein
MCPFHEGILILPPSLGGGEVDPLVEWTLIACQMNRGSGRLHARSANCIASDPPGRAYCLNFRVKRNQPPR